MSETKPPVIVSSADGIGRIRLNKPKSLNAMDIELAQAFVDAVRLLSADTALRVIIVESEGRSFMSGGDLAYFNQSADPSEAARVLVEIAHELVTLLSQAPQITIASLKGAVAGAGMSLAIGFDMAIAAENTILNTAYVRIGTSSDSGGTWALPRIVGMRKALEIALLADSISAAEALNLGLVNRVVPLEALEEETTALAQRLAAGAPLAQRSIKQLIRSSFEHTQSQHLAAELESFVACAATSDFSGAVAAFFEKKKYQFEGR